MEKEQKKLLLVAVSVGIFLLITVIAALSIVNQRTQPQEANIPWTVPQPVLVQPNPPAAATPEQINVNVDCEDSEITVAIDKKDGDRMIIQIPAPAIAAVPSSSETVSAAVPLPAAPAAETKPAQPARTQSAAAESRTAAPSKTINDYWIQTGAFSARVRAEDVKDTLAEKGLVSIIENREVNGQLWYRVRLGPYTTQREADYWLALVKEIDGFGDSQVRQTTRTQ